MKGDGGESGGPPEEALTYAIINAVIAVHSALGPGFLESIDQRALALELKKQGIPFATEVDVEIMYEGRSIGRHRLDLVVDHRVIVELKTVEELGKAHYAQVRSYMRATGLPVALLVNFSKEKADFGRVISSPVSPSISVIPSFLPSSARETLCSERDTA
jgi:GxxExxY protein